MTDEEQHAADEAVMTHDSDLAIAIGEHAFRAGYAAGYDAAHYDAASKPDQAWSDYAPPEELCGRSFAKLVTVSS